MTKELDPTVMKGKEQIEQKRRTFANPSPRQDLQHLAFAQREDCQDLDASDVRECALLMATGWGLN